MIKLCLLSILGLFMSCSNPNNKNVSAQKKTSVEVSSDTANINANNIIKLGYLSENFIDSLGSKPVCIGSYTYDSPSPEVEQDIFFYEVTDKLERAIIKIDGQTVILKKDEKASAVKPTWEGSGYIVSLDITHKKEGIPDSPEIQEKGALNISYKAAHLTVNIKGSSACD